MQDAPDTFRPRASLPLALAVAAPLLAGEAAGQEPGPLVTDRPDETESAAVVAPGLVQLETGWSFAASDGEGGEVEEHAVGASLLRIGVVPGLEARLGFGGWRSRETEGPGEPGEARDVSGASDVSVGAKVRLREGRGRGPDVAVLGALSLPAGAEEVSSGRADPSVRLALGQDLPDRLSLGVNVGVEWRTEEGPAGRETLADGVYTVALGVDVGRRAGVYVEGFGAVALEDGAASRASLDAGATYLLRDNLQLDVSGGAGLDRDAEDWFVGAGLSLRLPR